MKFFVINLDRRPDRWSLIDENFQQFELQRVSAVDGRIEANSLSSELVSKAEAACWKSHQNAMEDVSRLSAPALILEDDAVIRNLESLQQTLGLAEEIFKQDKNFVLQVGFIESLQSIRFVEYWFEKVIAVIHNDSRWFTYQNSKITLIKHSFLSGAHAYVISPNAAKIISKLNNPVAFPTDDFLGHLAKKRSTENSETIHFYRIKKSAIGQCSRHKNSRKIDSDIGTGDGN